MLYKSYIKKTTNAQLQLQIIKIFLILKLTTAYKKQRTTLCDANMIFGLILQPCVLIRLLSGYKFDQFIKHVTTDVTQRHLSFLYSVTQLRITVPLCLLSNSIQSQTTNLFTPGLFFGCERVCCLGSSTSPLSYYAHNIVFRAIDIKDNVF